MANVYNSLVTGFSKISSGTPAAIARKLDSVSLGFDGALIINKGINGQRMIIPGLEDITVGFSGAGVDKADMARWFPTTKGVQVANFPDFLAEVDDGSTGAEWVFEDGQPSSATVSFDGGPDAMLMFSGEMKFPYMTKSAIGTYTPVYNSYSGFAPQHDVVQIDGADADVLSWSLSSELSIASNTPHNTKSLDQKRRVDGYYITDIEFTLELTTSSILMLNESKPTDTLSNYDITMTLDNGTDAEDILITCNNFIPQSYNMEVSGTGDAVFSHSFIVDSGSVFGAVTFA